MKCLSAVFIRATALFLLGSCAALAAGPQAAPAPAAASSAAAKPSVGDTTAPRPSSPSSTPTVAQQIATLPRLPNAGIDATAQGKAILAHLNAILRFYRESTVQVQKVGEPSDALYAEQATSQATDIGRAAFQSARNLAALLSRLEPSGAQPGQADTDDDDQPKQPSTAQRLAVMRAQVQARITDLSAQDAALDKQITKARAKDLPALQQKDEQLEGQLELQKAMLDAFGKLSSMADAQTATGLAGDIDRLLHAAPELGITTPRQTVAPPALASLSSVRDAGVSSQAIAVFQLLSARHTIESSMEDVEALRKQATDLRAPMVTLLKSTIKQGDEALQTPPNTTDAEALRATRKHYDNLSATFRVLSTAALPLSQEVVLLEGARANLVSWRSAVDAEYSSILRSLLLRVLMIAMALILLAVLNQVWQRLTTKYVRDIRRRRQLLIVRRIVIGFFTGIVLIFGFVTQFSSLATFAGFITAGIAVGLQTILLSVAAYFFIVGRYGVRVGDRITVANVTGDVIEVGLVRFYMAELTGTGSELHATGRVAVFANSVLFQSGTPLYKQIPGTEYAWHELTVKLQPGGDYQPAADAILQVVNHVYEGYRTGIESQHQQVENWMDTSMESPRVEPRLQLGDAGLQYAVLFPVEIKDAAATDETLIHALLELIENNEAVKSAIAAPPLVKAVVKG